MEPADLDYEELVKSYENALLTKLRGHRADAAFLEMWVPDEDPVKSILNMVEAAAAVGHAAFTLRVREATLPATRHEELRGAVRDQARVELVRGEAATVVRLSGIGT